MRKQLESLLTETTKANLMLKAFSLTKVPLLFATGAKVKSINDKQCIIKIPFKKKVKNHLGSLYFGALAIGADACIGLLANNKIFERKVKVSLVFKSFEAQFLKRAEGPTLFICEQGEIISEMIDETLRSRERVTQDIEAYAMVQNEKVATFKLGLSLKSRN